MTPIAFRGRGKFKSFEALKALAWNSGLKTGEFLVQKFGRVGGVMFLFYTICLAIIAFVFRKHL